MFIIILIVNNIHLLQQEDGFCCSITSLDFSDQPKFGTAGFRKKKLMLESGILEVSLCISKKCSNSCSMNSA